MMKTKRYNGYKSFQYLDPGVDYRPFDLAQQTHRVPVYTVPVTEDQEALVQQILAEDMIVSLHEHTSIMPADVRESNEYSRQGRERTGFEGLATSGLDVVFENFMDGTATITSNAGWKWSDVIHDLGIRRSDFDHQEMLFVARTIDDLYRAKREDRIALVASFEAATPIENEVDRVDVLYGLGVRVMGITYSESNALGSGLKEPQRRRSDHVRAAGRAPHEHDRNDDRHGPLRRSYRDRDRRGQRTARADVALRRTRAVGHQPYEVRRRYRGCRRRRWIDRDRGRTPHNADGSPPPTLDRVGHGTLRVRRGAGRHRSRDLWA